MPDYIDINKKLWNAWTPHHIHASLYAHQAFMDGMTSLKKPELALLPNLTDKSLLHLQCHFGQDSISLARLGAQVTAIDLSDVAIKEAKNLAAQLKHHIEFICTDMYKMEDVLQRDFDIIYSSYGTITWLPDLHQWARLIAKYLRKGGRLYFIEFHPILWMFDDALKNIKYSYFNRGPLDQLKTESYAAPSSLAPQRSVSWNHNLAEVIQALIDCGLQLVDFQEYDYIPYDIFEDSISTKYGYQIKKLEGKIPMLYSIVAQKI